MSEEEESSKGGDSSIVTFSRGMYVVRCWIIVACSCLVLSGVRLCLYFVCRASFVKMLRITASLFWYVVCLIFARVWGSVNVS